MTELTVTRDNAVMSLNNEMEKAYIDIQLKAQEVQQDTSHKQQQDQALAKALPGLQQEAKHIRRKIQSDKDKYSQAINNKNQTMSIRLTPWSQVTTAMKDIHNASVQLPHAAATRQAHPSDQHFMYHTQDKYLQQPSAKHKESKDKRKQPAHPPWNNLVNLVARCNEERQNGQQEQEIFDHSH
jgi:hypothetical protein